MTLGHSGIFTTISDPARTIMIKTKEKKAIEFQLKILSEFRHADVEKHGIQRQQRVMEGIEKSLLPLAQESVGILYYTTMGGPLIEVDCSPCIYPRHCPCGTTSAAQCYSFFPGRSPLEATASLGNLQQIAAP